MHLIVESLLDFWCLNQAKENVYDRFKDLGVTVYQLVANHDAYYKNTNEVNSIDSLFEYDNVIPISGPGEYNIDGFKCSWFLGSLKKILKRRKKKCENQSQKVAFGHLELNGFLHILVMFNNMVRVADMFQSLESLVLVIITTPDQMMERSFILVIPISYSGMMWMIREDSTSLTLKILV